MDSPELEGLKTLCEKATPGPWTWEDWNQDDGPNTDTLTAPPETIKGRKTSLFPDLRNRIISDDNGDIGEADKAFIATARTALPQLIADVERYQWQPEWRPVVSHPGQFEVSRTGHVRKCDGTMVGEWLSDQGYVLVRLSGPRTVVRLHRLVADAFIPNANGLPYVNHIDCNRQNNASDNLEWCTQAENVAHSARLGRMDHQEPRRSPNAKLEDEVVSSIRLDSAKGGMSQVQIAKKYGVGKNTVNRIVNRQIYV